LPGASILQARRANGLKVDSVSTPAIRPGFSPPFLRKVSFGEICHLKIKDWKLLQRGSERGEGHVK
jgi:hypothetical protein